MGIGFFVLVFMWFLKGRAANDHIAATWNKAISGAVSENFAHFGTMKDPSVALE